MSDTNYGIPYPGAMPEPTPEGTAPERPARHPGTTGRRRLLEALTHARRGQVVVAVLLAAVGFGAVLQVRTNDDDSTYSGYREQDLIQVLNGLAGTSQRAQSEITRLQQSRAKLESDTSKRQAALDQANTQDTTLRILAGLVPVTGPGIRVTITETTGQVNVAADRSLSGRIDVDLARSQGAFGVPLVVGGSLDAPTVTLTRGALAGAALGTLLAPGTGTGAGAKLGDKVESGLRHLFGK